VLLPWPQDRAKSKETDTSSAIPVLTRIMRFFFGGSLIPGEEYTCWKCGYWLFVTEGGVAYCPWCGEVHRPPTPPYRPALVFACWTDEGVLTIV
jgi:hypothetical protein